MVEPSNNTEIMALSEDSFSSIPDLLRGWELRPACEIMLSVISNYLECRTISSPCLIILYQIGAWRLVSTVSFLISLKVPSGLSFLIQEFPDIAKIHF